METYRMAGKVYKVLPLQQKTDRFAKQEFVLQVVMPTTQGTYTEFIRFQCINDKISFIDQLDEGDFVGVKFQISGRKVGKKDEETFYTNLDVLEVNVVDKAKGMPKEVIVGANDYSDLLPGIEKKEEPDIFDNPVQEKFESDDLPF